MANLRYTLLTNLLEQLVNKIVYVRSFPHDYGTGEKISAAEIHAIEAIGRNRGINVTGLARILVVTKGAVSQIVKKLEDRGYVAKFKAPDNDKEVLLKLAPRGKTAIAGYEAFRQGFDANMAVMLESISDEEFTFLTQNFQILIQQADRYIESLEE
ncbi:MAG: MarR family transcriptional regulator [Proteobacteria bacterium]|nr:MarR family transcriptional regulator [Pseudomonadota bacterium]MBU1450843.1 MarR family transcriptional regulator [Pseudomonadota bacterium]MBU2470054.1 MarR family transcriptional regulator [Pseudomonadota bacterium]MBU2518442.1 MarR family transcriptional regulator [Pseudomonadota bacterium]